MVVYECFRCGYIGKQKGHLIQHLNRKNICNFVLEDISIELIKKHYGFENIKNYHPNDTQTTPKQHPNDTQTSFLMTPKQHPNDTQNAEKQHPNDTQTTPKLNNMKKCNFFCNKSFTRKSGLDKHLKVCKTKKESESLMLNQHSEILEMKKEIEELKKYKTNIQNQNNNIQIII